MYVQEHLSQQSHYAHKQVTTAPTDSILILPIPLQQPDNTQRIIETEIRIGGVNEKLLKWIESDLHSQKTDKRSYKR